MKYRREYMDMNQLGRLFGVSGPVVGSRLKKLGLRDQWRNPTWRAENQQLTDYSYERHGTYTKLWHVERTVEILQDAGLELASPAPELSERPVESDPTRRSEPANDEVGIVVTGETNARIVQRVMNIAHRAGILERLIVMNTQP